MRFLSFCAKALLKRRLLSGSLSKVPDRRDLELDDRIVAARLDSDRVANIVKPAVRILDNRSEPQSLAETKLISRTTCPGPSCAARFSGAIVLIHRETAPAADEQGNLTCWEHVNHAQHVAHTFAYGRVVEIGRLEQPAIHLQPNAGLVTQSVTAEKAKCEGWRPVTMNLIGRKAELPLSNFTSGPPRPEILIYLRLSRRNTERGHSNQDEYRERLAHFVTPFLLVRCPPSATEFFHLTAMAKLKAGPACGEGCLIAPLPHNHRRDNHSLG
jgi:hypothetical protein